MLEQAATCTAASCSNRRQHFRLQHARTGGNMYGCIMLKQAALVWLQHTRTGGTCLVATCSNKRHLSGCNMHEQAATCTAASCSNRRQHVRLHHAPTGSTIMLNFVTTSHFYGLLYVILVALLTKHKIFLALSATSQKNS
jgi:hypothetical protein